MTQIYQEWYSEILPAAGHGKGVSYRVFAGTVKWPKSDELRPAVVVFMQYGIEKDWTRAYSTIATMMPAHVLEEDVPAVTAAMERMRSKLSERIPATTR